jgi:putative hydrolase of the HAD superfamily
VVGINDTIGRRVERGRRRKGWHQRELAERIGRSESWMSQVERGVIPLDSVSLAERIALVLGMTVERILAFDVREHHMNRPMGLILDFGGVLTTGVAACALAFDRRVGLPDGTFLTTIAKDPVGVALYADLERGAITQTQWNERTAALLGIDGTNLLGHVLQDLHPEPTVIAAAQAARAAGVKVGIFSNSLGSGPHDVYGGYDLAANYDAVLISEDYRLRKPDPELYDIMLGLMELPGEECVFVDDTARNLLPAERLGITTVLATEPADTIMRMEAALGLRMTEEVQTGPQPGCGCAT